MARREKFAEGEAERASEKKGRDPLRGWRGGERAIVTGIKRSDFSSELSLRCFLFAPSLFPPFSSRRNEIV